MAVNLAQNLGRQFDGVCGRATCSTVTAGAAMRQLTMLELRRRVPYAELRFPGSQYASVIPQYPDVEQQSPKLDPAQIVPVGEFDPQRPFGETERT
jgi:hypothetical protein